MFKKITDSPTLVRVVPFALFLVLTFAQDKFGDAGRYWIYLGKSVVGAVLVALMWPHVREMRWKFTWEAVVVGIAVFVMWVGLDGWYPHMEALYPKYICPLLQKLKLASDCTETAPQPWNPNVPFGSGSTLAMVVIIGRILGSSLVVPPLEEVFYRSFVYRYLAAKDFTSVPFNRYLPTPFFVTALIFGAAHREWLAGILCAFAYQGLVIWKNRLDDAITAHAITNFLLGLWIVWKGEWHFW